MSTIQLQRVIVNLLTNVASIEFRRLDDDGVPERGEPRHRIELSDDLLIMLRGEAMRTLEKDVAPLESVPAALLASELHRLREARREHADARRMQAEDLLAHERKIQAATEELEENRARIWTLEQDIRAVESQLEKTKLLAVMSRNPKEER